MAEITNLLTKVADLSGTASSADRVETWLLDGARQMSKYGKTAGKIGEFTDYTAYAMDDSPTTLDIDNMYEIIEVTRGGGSQPRKICRYLNHNDWARASDSDSIFYENSAHAPVYTISSLASSTHLQVLPLPAATTGIVHIRFIPSYALSTDHIIQFPKKYTYLCVYYAAIHNLGRKLLDATITIPAFAVSPASPVFTYTDASVNDIIGPIIQTSIVSAPPSDLSITAILPVAPSLSSTTITESGITAPVYTAPVMNTPDWADTENWITGEEDPEMLSARVQEIQGKIAEYSASMQSAQASFNKDNVIFQKDLQIAIENARMSNGEDAEKLQKYGAEVQSYGAFVNTQMQEYSQNFTKWQTDSTLDLQIATQNAQAELTVKQANLSKDSQLNLQNALNNFQKELQEYQSALAKYQSDQQNVQAELAANAQTYQAEVAGLQIKLQQCQAMYQEAIQLEFQISLQADIMDKQGA